MRPLSNPDPKPPTVTSITCQFSSDSYLRELVRGGRALRRGVVMDGEEGAGPAAASLPPPTLGGVVPGDSHGPHSPEPHAVPKSLE